MFEFKSNLDRLTDADRSDIISAFDKADFVNVSGLTGEQLHVLSRLCRAPTDDGVLCTRKPADHEGSSVSIVVRGDNLAVLTESDAKAKLLDASSSLFLSDSRFFKDEARVSKSSLVQLLTFEKSDPLRSKDTSHSLPLTSAGSIRFAVTPGMRIDNPKEEKLSHLMKHRGATRSSLTDDVASSVGLIEDSVGVGPEGAVFTTAVAKSVADAVLKPAYVGDGRSFWTLSNSWVALGALLDAAWLSYQPPNYAWCVDFVKSMFRSKRIETLSATTLADDYVNGVKESALVNLTRSVLTISQNLGIRETPEFVSDLLSWTGRPLFSSDENDSPIMHVSGNAVDTDDAVFVLGNTTRVHAGIILGVVDFTKDIGLLSTALTVGRHHFGSPPSTGRYLVCLEGNLSMVKNRPSVFLTLRRAISSCVATI